MKQEQFMRATMLVAFLCIAVVASAREWHINNKQGTPAHFADINAAMASAEVADGDTLYLGAGCVINSNQTVSKRVTVIGTGWGYTDSPAAPAMIDANVYITANGAKLLSLYARGNAAVRASNVTLERCFINTNISHDDSNTVDNVKILSCWTGYIYGQSNRSTKWEIRNTYVDASSNMGAIYKLYNPVIENNFLSNRNTYIFRDCKYSIVKNNIIFANGTTNGIIVSDCENSVITYNVLPLSPDYESNYPGNVFINSMNHGVVIKNKGGAASAEYFHLIEGSPAIGAGEGGIDCGVLAGVYKFVPYGRPRNIPVLKEAVVPSMPTDGKVKVSFKIENQNE